MALEPKNAHFVVFPMMQQGHMIPMVDIARLIARHCATVTIVTTPLNALRFKPILDHEVQTEKVDIRVAQIEFPSKEAGFPQGIENADMLPSLSLVESFVLSTGLLHDQSVKLFSELKPKPTCILSDVIFHWTIDIAKRYGIPRIVFHGISCFALLCSHNLIKSKVLDSITSDAEQVVVPDLPDEIVFTKDQLPSILRPGSAAIKDRTTRSRAAEEESFGIVVNSFEELEVEYMKRYKEAKSPKKVWFVGPLCLSNKDNASKGDRGNKSSIDGNLCLRWLENREPGSVIYACHGTLCSFNTRQMMELGLGLEESKKSFVWVIRRRDGLEELAKWMKESGFEERINVRGFVIWGWAPQVLILSHPSIGGFLTHCGWNSTLEGVCAGLPMVTWPMFSDQFYNEKLITQIWKIGVTVGVKSPVKFEEEKMMSILVKKEDVAWAVETIMEDGEEGRKRKKRARELGNMAREAFGEGGSALHSSSPLNSIKQHTKVAMAVKTYTQELECSASAARVFKAACLDSHNFFPKVMPHAIKSFEFVQGDCVAPGNVKLLTYVSEGESKSVKHRVDEVDVEKFYYKYTTIEGDILGDKIECIVVEEKIEAKSSGCVVKMISHFHTKGDAELDEEKLKMGKEKITLTFKAVDEYLQANPDLYA